ncbi:MAG TPA: hypothetical protein VJ850_02640 [Candidatus Limnocylindrales bacterium]|nr:hypothetical protein [Candidatus Limnocylindrales bacterium]
MLLRIVLVLALIVAGCGPDTGLVIDEAHAIAIAKAAAGLDDATNGPSHQGKLGALARGLDRIGTEADQQLDVWMITLYRVPLCPTPVYPLPSECAQDDDPVIVAVNADTGAVVGMTAIRVDVSFETKPAPSAP